MIMILDVDVTAEGGIIKLIARKGNPQPSAAEPLSPPERSEYNPSTQPAAEPRPFSLKSAASAATTTL